MSLSITEFYINSTVVWQNATASGNGINVHTICFYNCIWIYNLQLSSENQFLKKEASARALVESKTLTSPPRSSGKTLPNKVLFNSYKLINLRTPPQHPGNSLGGGKLGHCSVTSALILCPVFPPLFKLLSHVQILLLYLCAILTKGHDWMG